MPVQNGREEDRSAEAQTTRAGADRQETRRGPDGLRGEAVEVPEVATALEGFRADLLPLACAVRGDAGRACEAVEGVARPLETGPVDLVPVYQTGL